MANLYVNGTSGTDDTVANGYGYATGTNNGPMKTILYAYAQASSGDTIKVENGAYDADTQGAGWYLNMNRNKFDITIEPADFENVPTLVFAGEKGIFLNCTTGSTITINDLNCNYNLTTGTGVIVHQRGDLLNHLRINGGTHTYTKESDIAAYWYYVTAGTTPQSSCIFDGVNIVTNNGTMFCLEGIDYLRVINGSITGTSSDRGRVVYNYANTTNVLQIENNTITLAYEDANVSILLLRGSVAAADHIVDVIIRNNTIRGWGQVVAETTMAARLKSVAKRITLENNNITLLGDKRGIFFGDEYQIPTEWAVGAVVTAGGKYRSRGKHFIALQDHTATADDQPEIGVNWRSYWYRYETSKIRCVDNTLTRTADTYNHHGMFFGATVYGAVVHGNKFVGHYGSYSVVFKCHNSFITDNIFDCFSVYFFGTEGNVWRDNTLAGTLTVDDTNTDTINRHCSNCIFTDNIIDGGTNTVALSVKTSLTEVADFYSNIFDNNCLWGGDDLASIDGSTLNTIAAIQGEWATMTGQVCTLNDSTSVKLDPNLDSNYRPRNRTVARMGIGAVAPTAQTLGGSGIFEIAP